METLKWYVANTYIDCNGEASVSFLAYQKNSYGTYLESDFKSPRINLYETEKKALETARLAGSSYSVHGTWR